MLAVDIFGLTSAHVHHRANSLRLADNARVLCFSSFAALCWFAFDQTLGDQLVAADLKGVEIPNTHTAFEESAILGAFSRKFAHFLENRDLDSFSLLKDNSDQFCTMPPTSGGVACCCVVPVPVYGSREREAVRLLPGSFRILYVLLQHFRVDKVVEVGIVLEGLNLFQGFLAECDPIGVHVIGFPVGGVFVTVRRQAAVVPLLEDALLAQEEFARRLLVDLVFQCDFLEMVGKMENLVILAEGCGN